MPVEVVQSNGQVAEVRLICDICGKVAGTRLMRLGDAQIGFKVVCQRCKEKDKPKKT